MKLHDRTFRVMIPAAEISAAIDTLAERINSDYAERAAQQPPLFLAVLNGAFMFAAELIGRVGFDCEVSFVKLASYDGTGPSGCINDLIGLDRSIEGRHVIVVEDTVDTGASVEHLLNILAEHRPASVEVAAMFFKPALFTRDFEIRYRAMEVGTEFLVGFGLDYNGLGRNYRDVYVTD
ncbi:MAG: hypoxanthine phosphoribosyltransferase [Alistipes sp.]|jgi:hypoxanthine phosphoribosyltransferase|nr:hypoxanthine phosphoribosyltransferase [Alistipes sp.]